MVRCPNCGQKTSGGYCQYCNYPILRSRRIRHRKAKKTEEVRKQAEKDAELAAKEKAAKEAEEVEKQIEESLKQVESICEELRAGKVETKEAIQRLSDISERIPE